MKREKKKLKKEGIRKVEKKPLKEKKNGKTKMMKRKTNIYKINQAKERTESG